MIAALADPETLLVFGVIAARTSKLRMSTSDGTRSTPYVTPYGLMRESSLSREVVEAAAERLKRAGLLEVLVDAELLTGLRRRYDQGVAVGISTNLSRPWHKGNHPGLQLARRLKRKAHQVWLFTTRLDVPATNNGSESAIRGFKLAAKVQGCWHTLTTLQRHCRIRSYLVSARNHARRPIDAIRDALTANPWMPPQSA